MVSTMWDKLKRILRGGIIAAFWIGLWWLIAWRVDQILLIPTPLDALKTLWQLLPTQEFWKTVGLSLWRVCHGFVGAVVVGTIAAIITAHVGWLRALLSPLLHIIRAAPVASFIILTMVWLDYDNIPSLIAFLMVLPIIWVNVEEGIRRTDRDLLEMARVYRLSAPRILTRLYLPSVKPFFTTACVNGLGFAWKSGVAAEVICGPDFAIGDRLQVARMYLETPEVFAWTAVVVTLSIVLEKLLLRVTKTARKEGAYDHA